MIDFDEIKNTQLEGLINDYNRINRSAQKAPHRTKNLNHETWKILLNIIILGINYKNKI